jgi:MoxR-like ATPase
VAVPRHLIMFRPLRLKPLVHLSVNFEGAVFLNLMALLLYLVQHHLICEILVSPPEFGLALSYNPGYQSVLKDLKQSTRQRFIALEFNYPAPIVEGKIIVTETGIDVNSAAK